MCTVRVGMSESECVNGLSLAKNVFNPNTEQIHEFDTLDDFFLKWATDSSNECNLAHTHSGQKLTKVNQNHIPFCFSQLMRSLTEISIPSVA